MTEQIARYGATPPPVTGGEHLWKIWLELACLDDDEEVLSFNDLLYFKRETKRILDHYYIETLGGQYGS